MMMQGSLPLRPQNAHRHADCLSQNIIASITVSCDSMMALSPQHFMTAVGV